MSLYKRGNIYWTKFGLRGQIFRQSLGTSDPDKARRKETQLIAKAAQGKLRAWTDPFERLPFHRGIRIRTGLERSSAICATTSRRSRRQRR